MKRPNPTVVFIAVTICLFGCQHDKPKPESNSKTITLEKTKSITVSSPLAGDEPFFVQYSIKGNDLYIECVLKDISFRKTTSNEAEAKIIIYVDGNKAKEANAAAFMLKDLTSGNHRIKMEVRTGNDRPYGKMKEFTITIP